MTNSISGAGKNSIISEFKMPPKDVQVGCHSYGDQAVIFGKNGVEVYYTGDKALEVLDNRGIAINEDSDPTTKTKVGSVFINQNNELILKGFSGVQISRVDTGNPNYRDDKLTVKNSNHVVYSGFNGDSNVDFKRCNNAEVYKREQVEIPEQLSPHSFTSLEDLLTS